MLEAEYRQILLGSVSIGAKEDESSTGHIWAAGFHRVTARSRLAGILKLMNLLFLSLCSRAMTKVVFSVTRFNPRLQLSLFFRAPFCECVCRQV
jgi:hypothetical protein